MFCHNCGKENINEAQFCIQCGTNLMKNVQMDLVNRQTSQEELAREYIVQTKQKIIKAYSEEEQITPKEFYNKAKHYDIEEGQVNLIFDESSRLIERINNYISDLYKECAEIELTTELKTELIRYGNALGIDEIVVCDMVRRYIKENEIDIKRNMLDDLVEEYAKSGEIKTEVVKKYKEMKTITARELYEEYKNSLLKMEKYIEGEYGDDKIISENQKINIMKMGEKNGFNKHEIEKLLLGYEEKSGIAELRKEEKKQKIYKKLEEVYSRRYNFFGREIYFGSKYYVVHDLTDSFMKVAADLEIDYGKIDATKEMAVVQLDDVWKKYEIAVCNLVADWEKILDIEICKRDTIKEFYNLIETGWNKIENISEYFGEEETQRSVERRYRQNRKDSRGKWVGGGFGVGGAIQGAVTAGAMNAVGGMAHSAVNAAGNLMTDFITNKNKKEKFDEFFLFVNEATSVNVAIVIEITNEIVEKYPEIFFEFFGKDLSEEEGRLREKIRSTCRLHEKIDLYERLLLMNPWNWRNGFLGGTIFSYKDIDNRTNIGFNEMMDDFEWGNTFKHHCERTLESIKRKFAEKNEDKIEKEEIQDLEEIILLFSEITRIGSAEYYPRLKEIGEELEDMTMLLEKVKSQKQHRETLQEIENEDAYAILGKAMQYIEQGSYENARELYVASVSKNQQAKDIVISFIDSKNKVEAAKKLHQFIKDRYAMELQEYEKMMTILSNIIDKQGKTFLFPEVEYGNHTIVNELIKYHTNVNAVWKKSEGDEIVPLDLCMLKINENVNDVRNWNVYNELRSQNAKRSYDYILKCKYKRFSEYKDLKEYIQCIYRNCSKKSEKCIVTYVGNQNSKNCMKARLNFKIPESEEIYIIYDDTVFQSCKKGFAMCYTGIYFSSGEINKITWDMFKRFTQEEIWKFLKQFTLAEKEVFLKIFTYIYVELRIGEVKVNIQDTQEKKDYRFCSFCGNKILRNQKFCNFCGKKLN